MGPQKCVSQDLTGLQTAGTLGTREFKGRAWPQAASCPVPFPLQRGCSSADLAPLTAPGCL